MARGFPKSGKSPSMGGVGKNNTPKGNTHRTLGKRVGVRSR